MITQKIVNLSNAMAEFEGWSPARPLWQENSGPTVSYRNHNPGNLRSSIFALGERDGFAYFFNDMTGMFAMQYDIMRKAQGKTRTNLTPDSTIAELLKVWSAAEGEELENYICFVSERIGLSSEIKIRTLIE